MRLSHLNCHQVFSASAAPRAALGHRTKTGRRAGQRKLFVDAVTSLDPQQEGNHVARFSKDESTKGQKSQETCPAAHSTAGTDFLGVMEKHAYQSETLERHGFKE